MSTIAHVTDENFNQLLTQSSKPVIVDVFAVWCGPCQHMAPSFEQLALEHESSYTFLKLDVDEARATAIQFGVTSVPTFLFFKSGKLVGQELGYMSKTELESKLKTHLG
jgi:thioredoxin 1